MVGELTVTNKFLATLGAGIPIVDTNYITVLKYMKIQEAFRTILKLGGAKVERWTVRHLSDLIPVRGRSSEGEAGRDGGIFHKLEAEASTSNTLSLEEPNSLP